LWSPFKYLYMESAYTTLAATIKAVNDTFWPSFEKLMRSIFDILDKKSDADPALELKLGLHKALVSELAKNRLAFNETVLRNMKNLLDQLVQDQKWQAFLGTVINEIKSLRISNAKTDDIYEAAAKMIREKILSLEARALKFSFTATQGIIEKDATTLFVLAQTIGNASNLQTDHIIGPNQKWIDVSRCEICLPALKDANPRPSVLLCINHQTTQLFVFFGETKDGKCLGKDRTEFTEAPAKFSTTPSEVPINKLDTLRQAIVDYLENGILPSKK
jgi:hypothetical protein